MISEDSSFPVPFKRVQFPVLGAYYLIINRAQGQTLGRAGLFLPRSGFCHGHLYLGFGRCGDPNKFFVYADQSELDNLEQLLEDILGISFTLNYYIININNIHSLCKYQPTFHLLYA